MCLNDYKNVDESKMGTGGDTVKGYSKTYTVIIDHSTHNHCISIISTHKPNISKFGVFFSNPISATNSPNVSLC